MEENYRLQELIESKTFDELTNEERAMVLKEMSEEEYTLRKSVIDQTRLFLGQTTVGLEPNEDVKNKAAFLLKEKSSPKKRSNIALILTYRIPIFIPVAAAILLLFTLPFVIEEPTEKEYIAEVRDTVQRVVYKTDTVIMEKEVIKPVQVIKYIDKEVRSNSSDIGVDQGQDRIVKADPVTMIQNTRLQLAKQFKQNGRSSGEMTEFETLVKMRDTLIYVP